VVRRSIDIRAVAGSKPVISPLLTTEEHSS
jgi:hypothetical protein